MRKRGLELRADKYAYLSFGRDIEDLDAEELETIPEFLLEPWLAEQEAAGTQSKAYDPSEPRDDGGKWTSGGSSSDSEGGGGKGEGKHPGAGYSKDARVDSHGVIHTSNVYDAQRALFEDRKVELNQPKQLSTLIKRLGETAAEMAEHGETAPTFNLCNVSVKGTNLFCADQIGIPRVEMPVIRAGATKDFIKYLKSQGYEVENGKEEARNLRATQSEISGEKVAASMKRIKKEGFYKRLVVSKDDYILDGHHTWAGQLGLDAKDNDLENDGREVKIARVNISITKLVAEAEKWTGGKGKKPASEAAKRGGPGSGPQGISAHTSWMNDCVPAQIDNGKDQETAIAACMNMWRDAWEETHPDGAEDPGPGLPGDDDEEEKTLTAARGRLRRALWDAAKAKGKGLL